MICCHVEKVKPQSKEGPKQGQRVLREYPPTPLGLLFDNLGAVLDPFWPLSKGPNFHENHPPRNTARTLFKRFGGAWQIPP